MENNIIRFPRTYTENELAYFWCEAKLYGREAEIIDFAPYLQRKRNLEALCLQARRLVA
jgi:hypothetical protein